MATLRDLLNSPDLNVTFDAMKYANLKLGDILYALVTPVSETIATSSDVGTLTYPPILGLVSASCNGAMKSYRHAGTLAAGQFTLTGTGNKTITFYSGEGHATTNVVQYYTWQRSVDSAGTANAAASVSSAILATAWPLPR